MITRKSSLFLMTAALALMSSAPALAHGPGGRPGPGGRGAGVPPARATHSVGLLRELVFPCPAACGDTARGCFETADSEALACATAACAAEIEAAQTACTADGRSDACRAAVGDLRDCAATCLDTRQTSLTACREALGECVDACTTAQ